MTIALPNNILCLCTENTVRSIMLEAILSQYTNVRSAGIDPVSFSNPITEEVIKNNHIEFTVEDPKHFDETLNEPFDLIIAVSEPAYIQAKKSYEGIPLEFWTTSTPPLLGEISRDACLESYQNIFNEMINHMSNRFKITSPQQQA